MERLAAEVAPLTGRPRPRPFLRHWKKGGEPEGSGEIGAPRPPSHVPGEQGLADHTSRSAGPAAEPQRRRRAPRLRPGRTMTLDSRELGITIVPFGEAEWHAAVDASNRSWAGPLCGRRNFGDCLAYATASVAADTLLFVGDDFRKTDICPAL